MYLIMRDHNYEVVYIVSLDRVEKVFYVDNENVLCVVFNPRRGIEGYIDKSQLQKLLEDIKSGKPAVEVVAEDLEDVYWGT